MTGLFIVLIPILIVDAINPVLLGGTIYSLGSHRPLVNTSGMLFSFFITYFLAGLIIAVALETLSESFHIPPTLDYVLELLVALFLFYFAWKQYREGDQHPERRLKRDKEMTLWGAAVLGFQINLVGLPFAIPYLAAIDQILKAHISVPLTFFVLLLYNAFYVLPFAFLILLRVIYKKEGDAIFEGINQWMHNVCVQYIPWIFVALGLLLIEDAVSYLLGYREYSFLSML